MTTKCSECGHEIEFGEWPHCPHESTYSVNSQRFDPVVIHRDAAGNIRYPGRTDARVPDGFVKVELKTLAEVRAFEKHVGRSEAARYDESRTRAEESFRETQNQGRSDLRQHMQGMSNYGRDFARHAIAENNKKSGRKKFDAGFRVEALS